MNRSVNLLIQEWKLIFIILSDRFASCENIVPPPPGLDTLLEWGIL